MPAQAKSKGARRITFSQFVDALALVAAKKGTPLADVAAAVLGANGPAVSGTKAEYVKFHDDKVSALLTLRPCMLPAWQDCQTLQHGIRLPLWRHFLHFSSRVPPIMRPMPGRHLGNGCVQPYFGSWLCTLAHTNQPGQC